MRSDIKGSHMHTWADLVFFERGGGAVQLLKGGVYHFVMGVTM